MSDIFCVLGLVGFVYFVAYWQGRDQGYEYGYSDAFKGKVKLIEFPDGERKYYKEKELKDLKEPFTIVDTPFKK